MHRTDFFHSQTVDGVDELDFLWNPLSKFSMSYAPTYYRVVEADRMRPDRISFAVYGTVEFWWIICLVNEIVNPLSDLETGQVLIIPDKLDIYAFQRKFRVRRSS